MVQKTFIGIDPSINSTGVVIEESSGFLHFYIIASKLTKTLKKNSVIQGDNWDFKYIEYQKSEEKLSEYWLKERQKAFNFKNLTDTLKNLLEPYKNTVIAGIEGISYGSVSRTSAIYDLAGLNYLIRQYLLDEELFVISPSDNKKFATGKGNANKDTMLVGFKVLYPELDVLPKTDDLCDAYFLKEHVKMSYGS